MDERDQPSTEQTDVLTTWLAGLRLGEPLVHRALTLVPLYADGERPGARYQMLAAALASGEVTVSEAARATVPKLKLVNKGALPVLILDGEEVVGGWQNRIVNTTLLVPAKCTFDLPVSCIEQGRWHEQPPAGPPPGGAPAGPGAAGNPSAGGRSTFGVGEAAYPQLRSKKLLQVANSYAAWGQPMADQLDVWDEVAERQRRVGAHSPTGAMRDVYRARQAELASAQEQLRCPDDGPVGVVALVSGRAVCADIFDQAETLRVYWPRLVRSYALEALEAEPAAPSLDAARRLLQLARQARRTAFPSPGLGEDVRISGSGIVGAALLWEGVAVHTAIFRHASEEQSGPGLRRPSRRAGWYQRRAGHQA